MLYNISMKITCLVENKSISHAYKHKHGLSFFIKTKKHNILFDVGPDKTYYDNAKKLGIDLSNVDVLVISHGHHDHGGGLSHFLKINKKAKIYIRKEAFEKHYTRFHDLRVSIGLNSAIKNNKRIVFTDDVTKIDDELTLFSNVTGRDLFSYMNGPLEVKRNKNYERDRFEHEQYLLISEDKSVLITGCTHNGIVNVLRKYDALFTNKYLDVVIGGFHLHDPARRKNEDPNRIESIIKYLLLRDEHYFTCHCTGETPYRQMKAKMKDQLGYIKAGQEIYLERYSSLS